jgi:peroxiredoxin
MRQVLVLMTASLLCLAGVGMRAMLFMAAEVHRGDDVREISGTDLDGNGLSLSDYRGKVVLLVFWSSNDPAMRFTQAYLKQLQTKFDGHPFRIIGVNGDDSREAARAISHRVDFDYQSFYDGPNGPIGAAWGVLEYPTFFAISSAAPKCRCMNASCFRKKWKPTSWLCCGRGGRSEPASP